MIVRNNDIIVSTTRPNRGAISLIKQESINIASTGFAILRNLKTDIVTKEYLFFCLRQQFCLKQMEQRSSGGNYPAITSEELKKIVIPVPPIETQTQIIAKFEQAYQFKQQYQAQAKQLLASIDTYLLEKLGIIIPSNSPLGSGASAAIFYTPFTKVTGNRLDPAYYKKEFLDLEQSIHNSKYKTEKLKDIIAFQAGYAFNSNDYVEHSKCHLVTIKNIFQNKIDLTNSTFLPDNYFEKYSRFQIKKDNLLIAMTGATIGKVGIFNLDENALLNQRVGILIPKDLNAIYLMSLLNMAIYQNFIIRNSNGGAQPNISETDILRIFIPLPPLEIQIEIANHIQNLRNQALTLEQQGQTLIEQAKQEIENIILGN